MLCQILFHVKAYHLIVTRFVGSVDLVMNDRLEYDSETREQIEATMHNAQRFLCNFSFIFSHFQDSNFETGCSCWHPSSSAVSSQPLYPSPTATPHYPTSF